jgi:hypothetical protein
MTRSASACSLGPEFDLFLFASIGADRNGMPLSVLSALARMDVDPWQEAARLTALPEATATRSLAALLAARPDGAWADTGSGATAARLIALLPRRAGANSPPRHGLPHAGATSESQVQLPVILLLIFMVCMLAVEALTATRRPPAQIAQAPAPASSTIVPKLPPPGGGT